MKLSNNQIKDIAYNTLQPHCDITMINISEVWENDPNRVNGGLTASVEVADHFTKENVKHLLLSEVDLLQEYFINQNQ